jgi:hypothetical protein
LYITEEWRKLAFADEAIANATTAATASKVANAFTVQYGGKALWSYDGSAAKTLNIKAGSNVSIEGSGNDITISSSYTNTTYSAGAGLTLDSTTFNVGLNYTTSGKNYAVKADGKNLYVNVPWTDTNTDTHWTSSLVTGSGSSSQSNAAATNGNVYLNLVEDSTVRNSHNIVGTGATTVTCDSAGKITIYSSDTNTDTKVTAVGNHYTPSSGTTKTTTDSGSTLAFGGNVITGVNVDAAGHIYSLTTSKLPNNPNTDTKVTAVGNHYTPSTNTSYNLGSSSTTNMSFGANVVTGLQRDAAGHVTGLLTSPLPANPSKSYNTGLASKTTDEIMEYLTKVYYTTKTSSDFTLTVNNQNIVIDNPIGDMSIEVDMNGWTFANILVRTTCSSISGKTIVVQTTSGKDLYEGTDYGLITLSGSKNVVETSIIANPMYYVLSQRNYGIYND